MKKYKVEMKKFLRARADEKKIAESRALLRTIDDASLGEITCMGQKMRVAVRRVEDRRTLSNGDVKIYSGEALVLPISNPSKHTFSTLGSEVKYSTVMVVKVYWVG